MTEKKIKVYDVDCPCGGKLKYSRHLGKQYRVCENCGRQVAVMIEGDEKAKYLPSPEAETAYDTLDTLRGNVEGMAPYLEGIEDIDDYDKINAVADTMGGLYHKLQHIDILSLEEEKSMPFSEVRACIGGIYHALDNVRSREYNTARKKSELTRAKMHLNELEKILEIHKEKSKRLQDALYVSVGILFVSLIVLLFSPKILGYTVISAPARSLSIGFLVILITAILFTIFIKFRDSIKRKFNENLKDSQFINLV